MFVCQVTNTNERNQSFLFFQKKLIQIDFGLRIGRRMEETALNSPETFNENQWKNIMKRLDGLEAAQQVVEFIPLPFSIPQNARKVSQNKTQN